MKIITKKILPEWFDQIVSGKKDYELRLADFDVSEGDILRLEEYKGFGLNREPTGRFIEKKINHIRKVDLKEWTIQQPEIIEKGFYVIRF